MEPVTRIWQVLAEKVGDNWQTVEAKVYRPFLAVMMKSLKACLLRLAFSELICF